MDIKELAKQALIKLMEANKPEGLETTFSSTIQSWEINSKEDIDKIPRDSLFYLLGNLIIDFNDEFDSDNEEHDKFFQEFLHPMSELYNQFQNE